MMLLGGIVILLLIGWVVLTWFDGGAGRADGGPRGMQ